MFVIVGSDPFVSWLFVVASAAAADKITSASCDSLLVERKCADENKQLKNEVSYDTESSDKAEVSQGGDIS